MSTVLHYESPLPIYALDWSKSPGSGPFSHLPRSSYRLALGTLTEDFRNRISIVGLPNERPLHESSAGNMKEDPYGDGALVEDSDMILLADALHGYPVTKIGWEPVSTFREPWKDSSTELLTSTGDALRIWEYSESEEQKPSAYVGRQVGGPPNKLSQKIALSSSKNPNPTTAPLTSFSWNNVSPKLIVTSSIDTTCTVWDLSASTAVTQLIAHDREVYDVAWAPGSVDSFVSVGADGSLRAFDLRSLEHSTILYETPGPTTKPPPKSTPSTPVRGAPQRTTASLLRIAFNPLDANFLATFHSDSPDVAVLDMRMPGKPVVELKGHRAPVSAIGWSSQESAMIATAGDDCQLLVWDLSTGQLAPRSSGNSATNPSRSPHPESNSAPQTRSVLDPVLAYTASDEINNLAWSPPLSSDGYGGKGGASHGEWIAIASGKSIKALKV